MQLAERPTKTKFLVLPGSRAYSRLRRLRPWPQVSWDKLCFLLVFSRCTSSPNTKFCPPKTWRGARTSLLPTLFVIFSTTWTAQRSDRTSFTQWKSAHICAWITCFASPTTWRPSLTSMATLCVSSWPLTCTTPPISFCLIRTSTTTVSRWVIPALDPVTWRQLKSS